MEGSTGSAADKKRNKLGYHRTSVACVHCRRRKIRCLLAPDDAQGRCENCIRLKKECHFFPVDQQPAVDKKGGLGPKPDIPTADVALATSPPILGGTPMMEQNDSYFQYPTMPMNPNQDISDFNPGAFAGGPIATFTTDSMVAPDINAPQISQPISWNDPTFFEQQVPGMTTRSAINPAAETIMHQGSAPLAVPLSTETSITPPQLPAPIAPTNMPGDPQFPQGTAVWSGQPTRPMSITGPGGIASTPQQQYPSQFHRPPQSGPPLAPAAGVPEYKRRMTTPAGLYPQSFSPPISDLRSSTVSVSYENQASTPFAAWNTLSDTSPETAALPGQVIIGTAPDSQGVMQWYPADALQYPVMTQGETPLLPSQGHIPFHPGPLQKSG